MTGEAVAPLARVLPDEGALLDFAARVVRAMPRAGEPRVVYLRGDLGAGKTTFARGALRALGEAGPVRSPTYGLVAEYATPAGRVLHLDLYRLQGPEELAALGLPDLLPDSLLWLVEWPERGTVPELPAPDLVLQLDVAGAGRRAQIEPRTVQGREWVTALSAGPE